MKFVKNGKTLVASEHPLRLTDNRLSVDKQLASLNTFKLTKGQFTQKTITPTVEFCIQRLWQDEARRKEKISHLQQAKKMKEDKEIEDIVTKATPNMRS